MFSVLVSLGHKDSKILRREDDLLQVNLFCFNKMEVRDYGGRVSVILFLLQTAEAGADGV